MKTKTLERKALFLKEFGGNELKIVKYKIDDLCRIEYYNKEIIAGREDWIKTSVSYLSFIDPIIINAAKGRENIVIDGWARVETLKKYGEEYIEAIEVCLNHNEEKEAYFILNQSVTTIDDDSLINLNIQRLQNYFPELGNYPVDNPKNGRVNKDGNAQAIIKRAINLKLEDAITFDERVDELLKQYNVRNFSILIQTLINEKYENN